MALDIILDDEQRKDIIARRTEVERKCFNWICDRWATQIAEVASSMPPDSVVVIYPKVDGDEEFCRATITYSSVRWLKQVYIDCLGEAGIAYVESNYALAKSRQQHLVYCKWNWHLEGMDGASNIDEAIGLRASIAGQVSQADNDRLGLEMNLSEIPAPKTEKEIRELIDGKMRHFEHYYSWRERVYKIQAHHKISGIELYKCKILGAEIEQPNVCSWSGLPLIAEDMPTLREYRPKIVSQFMELLRVNGVKECKKSLIIRPDGSVYHDYEDSVVSIEEILVAAPLYDWAYVWNNYGYAQPSISFGNGLDGTSAIAGHVSFEAILPCS
jgi:hypothetical protein